MLNQMVLLKISVAYRWMARSTASPKQRQTAVLPPQGPEAQQHQRYADGGEKVVEPKEIQGNGGEGDAGKDPLGGQPPGVTSATTCSGGGWVTLPSSSASNSCSSMESQSGSLHIPHLPTVFRSRFFSR